MVHRLFLDFCHRRKHGSDGVYRSQHVHESPHRTVLRIIKEIKNRQEGRNLTSTPWAVYFLDLKGYQELQHELPFLISRTRHNPRFAQLVFLSPTLRLISSLGARWRHIPSPSTLRLLISTRVSAARGRRCLAMGSA